MLVHGEAEKMEFLHSKIEQEFGEAFSVSLFWHLIKTFSFTVPQWRSSGGRKSCVHLRRVLSTSMMTSSEVLSYF